MVSGVDGILPVESGTNFLLAPFKFSDNPIKEKRVGKGLGGIKAI